MANLDSRMAAGTGKARVKAHWLRTCSSLAAAAALATVLPDPAMAQSGPGAGRFDNSQILAAQRSARKALPGEVKTRIPEIPGGTDMILPTSIGPEPVVRRGGMPVPGGGGGASPGSSPALPGSGVGTSGATGSFRTGAAAIVSPRVSTITTTSSTPAPSPGDTDTAGINVQASANYFSSEVDFRPATGGDVVELLTSQAIINWTTFTAGSAGSDVTFLGAGGNLEFTSALADYTVLNRVFTPGIDSAIRIDGAVTSTVLGGIATGGNVWFYSPGGIVVGATGSFNVGSLVLSSSDLSAIGDGGMQMDFIGTPDTESAVVIEAGADIDATNPGSYVALVAPQVVQGGSVDVNGSAAYVAAEQVQLTINNGLFDITVGVGSGHSSGNGIIHTGETTGDARQVVVDNFGNVIDADAQAIYMVAVPKNNAITMLVGGTIGYRPAVAAARSENGVIILSAGADVTNGGGSSVPDIRFDTANATDGGSIVFQGGTMNSDVIAVASDIIDLTPAFGETFSVGGDALGSYSLSLTGGNLVRVGAGIGGEIAVSGDVTLRSGLDRANGSGVVIDVIGNVPGPFDPVFADGTITVGGNLTIDASGNGRDDFFTIRDNGNTGIGEDATGGSVSINIANGNFQVGGNLIVNARAQGGKGEQSSGSATGGDIDLTLSGGTMAITGSIELLSGAINAGAGKIGGSGLATLGSDGVAGDITVSLSGGALTAGSVRLDANAQGTSGAPSSAVEQSNDATPGDVSIDVSGGNHTLGSLNIVAVGSPGTSFDANGNRISGLTGRGTAEIAVSNDATSLNITGDLDIAVDTLGVAAPPSGNAVMINVTGTGAGGLFVGDDIFINAGASSGNDDEVTESGTISISANGGAISFDTLFANTSATPVEGFGNGIDFAAGDILLTANNGGSISGRTAFLQAIAVGADGMGGDGTGGLVQLLADDGSINFTGTVRADTTGLGGVGLNDGTVGVGMGGTIRLTVQGTNGAMSFASLNLESDGRIVEFFGEEGPFFEFTGNGGRAFGGLVEFNILGGTFDAGNVTVSADGEGGTGGTTSPPNGIIGTGDGSIAVAPSAFGATAVGFGIAAVGGGAPSAGDGGDGQGGDVVFNLDGGTVTVTNLTVSADGIGGDGSFGDIDSNTSGGAGGDGLGGTVTFDATSGTLTVTNTLTVSATGNRQFDRGNGGFGSGTMGGDGGNGIRGAAIFNLDGTATINAGAVLVSTEAFGGRGGSSGFTFDVAGNPVDDVGGGTGGNATGGDAVFNNVSGTISFTDLTVRSNAIGGDGGDSFGLTTGESQGDGGNGGAGRAGTATINLDQDDASNPTYIVEAMGTGGNGGTGRDGGAAGLGVGGTARLNVNNVDVTLNSATINASAVGGMGGFSDGDGGNGGNGGDAIAGSAELIVDGAAANLSSAVPMTLVADALGGVGAGGAFGGVGGGQGGPGGSVTGGQGGSGGSATGGTVLAAARNGATLDLSVDGVIRATGTGGAGGAGGSSFSQTGGAGGLAGNGTGGTIEFQSTGGSSFTVDGNSPTLTLDARGIGALGGAGGFDSTGTVQAGFGGNGQSAGGTVTILVDGTGSTLAATGALTADARATGQQDMRAGAIGAGASGGTVSITASNSGAFSVASDLIADVSATAASGSAADATGGNIAITASDAGTLAALSIDLNSDGIASDGDTGEAGGNGTGGTITLASATDLATLTSLTATAIGTGGNGGAGNFATAGGAGGLGQGGAIRVEISGTGPLLSALADFGLDASATGGVGGSGGVGDNATIGAIGGFGGTGQGGSATFAISGNGGSITIDPAIFALVANAVGGTGGNGGGNFDGGDAGDGGQGGAGVGGTVTFEAGSGSTMTLGGSGVFTLSSTGTGGDGGEGGDFDMILGGGAGNGGDGGTGTGGSPSLRAIGGTITGGDTQLLAVGTGGNGGIGGDEGTVTFGATGNGGMGVGGSPLIEVLDGSPGIITLGSVTIDASAIGGGGTIVGTTTGGSITITDASTDPVGLITMTSLTAIATGALAPGTASFTMTGGSGPITVTDGVFVNVAGDIVFDFDATGQLLVGDSSTLNAGGDIIVTHTNNAGPTVSIDNGGNFTAAAQGNFDAQAGSIISANELIVVAGGNVGADDLRAIPGIVIQAGGDVLVNDAIAVGPQGASNFRGITINAGLNPFGGVSHDPSANATITGAVDSYADIAIDAGGNAVFQSGSAVVANDQVIVRTGDDIIVQTGASITSSRNPAVAPNPATPFVVGSNLQLLAGDITTLTSPILTPISSIVIDGSLEANDAAVILTGNAIDGLGGAVSGSSLRADINDAPAPAAAQSDDDGLLDANCLEGNICLGDIMADNRIEIGQASNNDVIQLIIEQGTVNANDILITTRNDIVMGTNGIATTLNATNLFSATSLTGNVDLRDASIASNSILIDAAGSLLGSSSLTSANDIGITVGQDLVTAAIDTGGELTSAADAGGALEGFYSVPGTIMIGDLSVGVGNVSYNAGGDILLGSVTVPGTDIDLDAPGAVSLGFTDSATNVTLDGGQVVIGDVAAANSIDATSGSNIDFTTLASGADITLNAPGAITGGDLDAGGTALLDGGSIAIGNASANAIDFTSAGDILFDMLTSPNAIGLTAASGTIGANTGSGDIDSDGDVNLLAQAIDLGNVTSGGSVDAQATAGDASFGTVDAANDITIAATGTPSLVNAISGGNTSITGASVTLNNGAIGGDLVLNATAGDIDGTGMVAVGGGIDLTAIGNIGFDDLDAQGGDFVANAGGNIAFANAAAAGAVDFTASGAIAATGDVTAGTDINLVSTGGGDIAAAAIDAGETVTISTTGGFAANSVTASQAGMGLIDIDADSGIDIDMLAGNDATLTATGSVTVDQDIDIANVLSVQGTGVLLRSSQDLAVNAIATNGDVDIAAAGNLAMLGADASANIALASDQDVLVSDAVNAGSSLSIVAAGLLDIDAAASGQSIDLQSADIEISNAGSLGRSDTTQSIAISTSGDAMLGGTGGSGAAYELDNDEFSRIFSGGDIAFTATMTGPDGGTITVGDLDVAVGAGASATDGNIGTAGSLVLNAEDTLQVDGALAVTNAGAGNMLSLNAETLLRVVADTGSITILDGAGALAGTIDISATDFVAVTDAAFADIQGMTVAEIDTRLAQNDGVDLPDGFIRADTLNIDTTASQVFIQNTAPGTDFDDRRGFQVNTLTISDSGGTAQPIVINGVVGGQTGIGAIGVTTITSTSEPASTINGCLIADPASCGAVPGSGGSSDSSDDPIQDLIDRDFDPNDPSSEGIDSVLIEVRDQEERTRDPLIEDPVTGAGNEDFWVGDIDCTAEDEAQGFCSSGETGGQVEEAVEPAE